MILNAFGYVDLTSPHPYAFAFRFDLDPYVDKPSFLFLCFRFYSILDMSEGLIFIHVSNPRSADHGTLYTSGSNGTVFSESLERHLFTHNTLTDFYRVKGMRGIFITAQV